MAWGIYLMASLALPAVGWLVTVFCVKRVMPGVLVNAAWLVLAGVILWHFEDPFRPRPEFFCGFGWSTSPPTAGAPLVWNHPGVTSEMRRNRREQELALARKHEAEHPGESRAVAIGPAFPKDNEQAFALNLLLWSLPILAFWFLLLRRSKGQPKPKRK